MRYVQLRGGTYFYRRRYPADLAAIFGGAAFKFQSLKTRSPAEAAKRAVRMAAEDDAEWSALRTNTGDMPSATPKDVRRLATVKLYKLGFAPGEKLHEYDLEHVHDALRDKHQASMEAYRHEHGGELPDPRDYLDLVDREMLRQAHGRPAPICLSDALDYYLKEHSKGRQKKFADDKRRSIAHVLRVTGADLPLIEYRKKHAEAVRDDLLNGRKTQSVRRHLNDIGAVFQKGIIGFDLQIARHPFTSVAIRDEREDTKRKLPFSPSELEVIVNAARLADDGLRHMAAILVNTGARVSEIVGLKCSDVVLEGTVPFIVIEPDTTVGRTLKTKGSKRKVPLVGISLWGAKRALERACIGHSGGWLFPKYISARTTGKLTVQSGSAGPSVPMMMRHRPAGSLPLRAEVTTSDGYARFDS